MKLPIRIQALILVLALATATVFAVEQVNDTTQRHLEPVRGDGSELEDFAATEEQKAKEEEKKLAAEALKLDDRIKPEVERLGVDTRHDLDTAAHWVQSDESKLRLELPPEIERLDTDAGHDLKATEHGAEADETKLEQMDPEIEKLRVDTVRDLEDAGQWIKVDDAKLDAYLSAEGADIKKEVLKEEQKAGFWLEGRPVSSIQAQAIIAHNNLLVTTKFPSASQCAECHPGQYRQWSVSSHAYAQMSPVYNSMQARINDLTHGTNGDFCVRCHNQVGMSIGEPIFTANENRLPVTREGISCIVCHRIKEAYGRVSGRFSWRRGRSPIRCTGRAGLPCSTRC